MPSGSAVIKYPGKRGVVWYVKFRDASGRQVKERLGREDEGWTKAKARAELRARETDVRREGLIRAKPVLFRRFAEEWLETYPAAKGLKRSTAASYRGIIEKHLAPSFGHLKVGAVTVAHLERYVCAKRQAGLAPRTINRHLNLLHELFAAAIRHQLARTNPVSGVDRPREPRRRWTILSPAEIDRVERAFSDLIVESKGPERIWREQARVIFLTVLAAGLRRGEILGLRWRDVDLVDPDGARLRVRETWVRGGVDSPKSEAGERTVAIGPRLSEELWQHRRRSHYAGEDERVFVAPLKGTPFDVARYAGTLRAALIRAGIDRPMRPFHDGRHTSITNSAAAGVSPAALMARAGHADFATTQVYIDLAGESFREEAERLETRIWGQFGTRNRYQLAEPEADTASERPGGK
jgi:integrase